MPVASSSIIHRLRKGPSEDVHAVKELAITLPIMGLNGAENWDSNFNVHPRLANGMWYYRVEERTFPFSASSESHCS